MDDVMDLMSKDYPEKYEEFMLVLRERQRQQQLETRRQREEQQRLERADPVLMMKKAVQAAADFNKQFMKERREDRQAYFDLQTHEVHFPTGKYKALPPEATKVGAYPVALIPGQFQNYYKKYSTNELKYFPINTTMYSPPRAVRDIYGDPVLSEEEEKEAEGEKEGAEKKEEAKETLGTAGESSLKKKGLRKDTKEEGESSDSASDSEAPTTNKDDPDGVASDTQSIASSQRTTSRSGRNTPLARTPKSGRKRAGTPSLNGDAASEKKKVKKVKQSSLALPSPAPPLPSPSSKDYKKAPRTEKSSKPGKRKSSKSHEGPSSTTTAPPPIVIRLERGPEGSTSYGEVIRETSALCSICNGKEGLDKNGEEQDLVCCADCRKHGHPNCLELTEEMVSVIKTYPWQCMECKTCVECKDPSHEERMLFCDHCDRGYHTFCVGVNRIPTGRWECVSCRGDHLYKGHRGRGRPRLKPKDKDTPSKQKDKDTPSKQKDKDTPAKAKDRDTPAKAKDRDTPAKPKEKEAADS